jgi:DNA-binding GntR family transcriptional regulator
MMSEDLPQQAIRPTRKRRSTSFDVSRVTPLDPVGEGPVITDLVHRHLRDAILEGSIPAGGIISQVELSQHLGVSRTPLREAIRRLEQEGLVEATPRMRARVRSLDEKDIEFAYVNRILLESVAIALTTPALGPDDFDVLDLALAEMTAAVEAGVFEDWEAAHRRFHRGLLINAPERMVNEIENLAARSVLTANRELYLITVSQGFHAGPGEHEAILAACRARDATKASALLARHLSVSALAVVTQLMPEHEPASIRVALRLIAGPETRGA